jgi:endonuclease/exonuclease/phosphatase family metal-dependent hydrolase
LAPLAVRAPHFCRRLDESGVDVVAFQEVWSRRALGLLRGHLPAFPFVAWRRAVGGRVAGGLVVFSRLPVRAMSYTSFRGVRPTAGGALFRLTHRVNSGLKGVLVVELDGLTVATTHLTANRDGDWSSDNRHHGFQRAQLELLQARLRDVRTAGPTVLAGDLNLAADGPLYPMVAEGWRDPFAGTDPATYHVELLPPGSVGRRIDYLLVSGDETHNPVIDSGVLFAEPLALPDGRRTFLSDHVALTVHIGVSPC